MAEEKVPEIAGEKVLERTAPSAAGPKGPTGATAAVPRASLVGLSLLHALVLAVAGWMLPWPALTLFAVLAGATAFGHLVVVGLAIAGSRHRAVAWRTTGLLSLGLLGYVTYAALGSGLYINLLYEGVGTAILAASVAAWCVATLFLLPYSLWGIYATGGFIRRKGAPRKKGGPTAIVAGLVLLAVAAASQASSARGQRHVDRTNAELDDIVIAAMATLPRGKQPTTTIPSLFSPSTTTCAQRVHDGKGATVFVTFFEAVPEKTEPAVRIECIQDASIDKAVDAARAVLAERQAFGDAVIDVVTTSRELPDAGPLLGPIVVRAGLEAVCEGPKCLLAWQLFGLDAFTQAANISALQASIGVTAEALRKDLGSEGKGFLGLDAITTRTYLVRGTDRSVTPLRHLRAGARPLDPQTVEGAMRDAVSFVVGAQVKDGRFRYTVQPFTGVTSFENFNVPRQAGTTLALCDTAAYSTKAAGAAKASLGFLSSLVQTNGDMAGIVWPKGRQHTDAPLGNTALTMIAMLRCRSLVGNAFDETIVRLGKTLLAMQRKNGSFAPAWRPDSGELVDGRSGLYADGQGVFALVLWEGADGEGLEKPADLHARIDRAMDYYAGPYWNIPLRDFFYLEENWHCMAAKAALPHHRHDKYERFCTDYMTMKMRFIQSPSSGVDEDHVGSYAFGHVFLPHHAAAAGFAEGLAASIEIKRARNEPTAKEEQVLRWTMAYLLRFQWREDNCFMCTRKLRIVGGFSENAASPIIRIDFAQHAMSGMFHGGQALNLIGR